MKTPAFTLARLLLLVLAPASGMTQHPPGIIDIEGRVIEQIEGREVGVGGIRLFIANYGDYLYTDPTGAFAASIPADGQPFQIEIHHPRYNILTPPGGRLQLSEFTTSTFKIELKILVRGAGRNEALEEEIHQLNARMERLQQQKRLSAHQIAKLQQQMLDTILHFQGERRKLENRLAKAETRNRELGDSVETRDKIIAAQRDSIETLIDRLYVALEEQYLRQQEIYEDLSGLLKSYRSRAADLNDWLPRLKSYFRDPTAAQDYVRTIEAYNDIYNALQSGHEGLLTGIAHYWKHPAAVTEARQTCLYALEEVHRSVILPYNQTLLPYFEDRPPKVNRAQKEADAFHTQLNPLIERLEEKIDATLQLLRNEY